MKFTFLGTRGGIIARSPLHYRHSSLLISFRSTAILIDWGEDWLEKKPPRVAGLLITHAHPDHVGGIAHGFPAPVYATHDTWERIKRFSLRERTTIISRKPFTIGPFMIESFHVYHSIHAPAVGYRIQAGKRTLFYVPDLIKIIDEEAALKNVDLYVGDGAIITRSLLVRTKNATPVVDVLLSESSLPGVDAITYRKPL